MTIGHILPLSKEHQTVNPVFSDFIAGVGERFSRSGYSLSFSVVRDEDEAETYRDLAASGAVDGVVLHGPRIDDPR
ncbi:MAG: LacI family transcriptional regulator, partial [Boseongicola sp. SB0677_bin_26]|nr:LacI family transcriptional regulator [Boseongicola sp. SB0677_bin_26]